MSGTPPSYISGVRSGGFTYTSGQYVDVVSGGIAYNMTIDKGANEYLDAAGSATNNIVNKGGEIDLDGNGAYASGTALSGGIQSVTIGAAYGTMVYAGGVEDVSSSGTDSGSMISSGGGEHVYSGGIAYHATVAKGGTEFITQGGSASVATVKAGGRLILGGDVLYDGNFKATSGTAKAVGVYKGGVETITFTGLKKSPYDEIVNTATANGYDRSYYSSGVLDFTEDRIGNEIYYTSGSESFSASSPRYTAAGAAGNVTIASGGSVVLGDDDITNLKIASGGEEIIGGKTTVHSGGGVYKFNFSGVTVSDSVIGKGVKQIVNAGNTALGATIAAGGTQLVKAGATAENTVIAGGTVNLAATAKLTGGVSFTGTGGDLVISATTLPTTTISGFAAGDKIQLAGIVYSAGATAKVKTAGVVTIADGANTYKLNLAGAAVGQAFSFATGSVLTTTAAAARMAFVTPESAGLSAGSLPALADVAHVPAAASGGWVDARPIAGAAPAVLTSAAPTPIPPITLSGGTSY